ncbi:GNAT family N-acetyltransferase [Miltoncostaea marina]|uniref:GNAT family N-acetyltransferase n=1 Tax=Miltoncostaea marina TaxID=2843215 RepID=UPI001C3E4336|nr:GNAT family N-acetyltransferase [Miltoncostaea marina]
MSATPPGILLRPARPADAPAIAAIVAEALRDKYRPALGAAAERAAAALLLRDLREMPGSRHLVAELDGRVAGAAHVMFEDDAGLGAVRALAAEVGWPGALRAVLVFSLLAHGRIGPDEAYIDELAVAPWARRRGVARALLWRCEHEARARGRARLTLLVTVTNDAARPLYASAGFREVRRIRWLAGRLLFRAPGAILMERRLAPG